MTQTRTYSGWGLLAVVSLATGLGSYFAFAAIQGEYGVLRRAEITSFSDNLSSELMRLNTEVVQMENLTQRLTDEYLDIDLLDERVREILGYVRSSELVVN